METASTPLQKSRVRVFPITPLQTYQLPPIHLFIIFIIIILNIPTTTSITPSSSQISYAQHCNTIVPESTPTDTELGPRGFLQLNDAYVAGGDAILGQTPKSIAFRTQRLYRTDTEGVLKIEGSLILRSSKMFAFPMNRKNRILYRVYGGIPARSPRVRFGLNGFWSSASGKLCMVGSSSRFGRFGVAHNLSHFSAVLKLNYLKNSTILSSLVSGTLDSLDTEDSLNYFGPVSILGVSQMNYEYTLIMKENENWCSSAFDENMSLGIEADKGLCPVVVQSVDRFELEYGRDCDTVSCNPLGGGIGYLPNFMSFNAIRCSDKGRVRFLLGFSNSSYNGYDRPFDPNTTLVAEGAWDDNKNRLCFIACRILNFTDSLAPFVGDCSIKLTLRLPSTLSIRNRSMVVGQIWSNRTVNNSGYFGSIVFRSSGDRMKGLPGQKYEYTEIDSVRKSCAKKNAVKHKGRTYPNGYTSDMSFDMSVRNSKGKIARGFSSPFFVGDQFYVRNPLLVSRPAESAVRVNNSHSSILNISYKMSFNPSPDFKLGYEVSSVKSVDISAEGLYVTETGVLCMVGCRRLGSNYQKSTKNDSVDCEILVNVQFPPLNAEGGRFVKGTIESTRRKSDPLYFEHLELSSSSVYSSQAKETIWRMDLEITMVLISNTLACVLVGLQLFYVKKHPDALPFISVVMLIVLTLGHMIPLLLNFEALFLENHNRQNVFLGSGVWLEVNEVVVRVVTMIVFLLEFRLLQLTWSARVGDGSQNGLWVSEKKVFYLSLPLYIGGGLTAWFVHRWKNSYQSPMLRARFLHYRQHSLWWDLKSYAGLVLDSFLLPQIMFNLFCNSKEQALAPSFYAGTTVVRLLPHAYDLYRAHSSTGYFDLSYIYANPRMDLYSTAWDVIILCGGLLFVVLIYLQQRFGGRCILPKRFRESSAYEKVPVVSSE